MKVKAEIVFELPDDLYDEGKEIELLQQKLVKQEHPIYLRAQNAERPRLVQTRVHSVHLTRMEA